MKNTSTLNLEEQNRALRKAPQRDRSDPERAVEVPRRKNCLGIAPRRPDTNLKTPDLIGRHRLPWKIATRAFSFLGRLVVVDKPRHDQSASC